MKRRTIGELVFWGAAALALALYFLTMPNGLPWRAAATENGIWRYLVAMAGGSATTLTCLAAAGAAGLLGALVNRYFGWRVGIAAAIVWIFLPGVWNGAIVGEQGVVMASAIVVGAWMANAVVLGVTRKMRATLRSGGQGLTALPNGASAHEVEAKRGKVNRIAGWALLGAAGIFAVVSISMHDYLLGEAASVYARLVVEEAGERIILMNGLCDEQIVEEVKVKGEGEQRRVLSLKDTEANWSNVVAFAKFAFPSETNLWLEAEVGPTSFAEAAVKAHPDRFYTMQGQSTTPEKWAARWEAMKPYLASRDRFIPAMRRAFAYEGNVLGNRILEEKVKVKGAIERSEIAERSVGLREQRNLPTGSEGTVGASVHHCSHFASQSSLRSVDMLARNQAAADSALIDDCGHAGRVTLPTVQHNEESIIHRSPSPQTLNLKPQTLNLEHSPTLSGEELYAQARAMPHQPIPDFAFDGEYLTLLVKSAELGYPMALAKLGEYAMRRGCDVEAYYWLWRAKRGGMANLDRTLLQIRSAWADGDFCREIENEYEGFSHEQGTVGYALLCIDARHNADAAKARLAECAPDFLVGG